jgi:CheY-like chemotaxis protein
MLEHSRGVSGERREVDLNALVDEALNLAYHGARAQDAGFNITLERDLDPAVVPIELAPQEITRVFLNLIGNGLYAATKRARGNGEAAYRPTLQVSTRDLGEAVEIRVRDKLLRQIKTRRPDLPVMMVTAYGDDERRRLASEYGAAEFITKPVDFDLLKTRPTLRTDYPSAASNGCFQTPRRGRLRGIFAHTPSRQRPAAGAPKAATPVLRSPQDVNMARSRQPLLPGLIQFVLQPHPRSSSPF